MSLSGKQYRIVSGEQEATIAEVGAGLRSYTVGGVDVTCSYGEDELPPKGCGMTLAPWPNRIRDGKYTFDGVDYQLPISEPEFHNASHGLGRWARWELVEQADDLVRLRLDVVPQKGYPFELRCEVQYSFRGGRGLGVELSAHNSGTRRAPFGMGSHPYLSTRGTPLDEVRLDVPAREILDVDEQKIPVNRRPVRADEQLRSDDVLGTRRLDQGFTGLVFDDEPDGARGRSQITNAANDRSRLGAALWFDSSFEFLQVFTVDDLTPGQSGIAIEPMTCAPDAFNSGDGLMVLEPGETWSGHWGVHSDRPDER